MSRDKVLPDAFAKVHARFKTPYVALTATGAIIVFMVVAMPIRHVTAAADMMFVGVSIFLVCAQQVAADDKPRITYEDKGGVRTGRAILAPVANPGHVDTVVRMAAALASSRNAAVVVLNVVRVPRTLPIAEGRSQTAQAEPGRRGDTCRRS